MVGFFSWQDQGKAAGNRHLVDEVLKQKMGFDGLVISDWNAIGQVEGCTNDHCARAVNAGIDLFMVPHDWRAFIPNTIADVEAGDIPISRIDDAVTRILRVKSATAPGEWARICDELGSRTRTGIRLPKEHRLARAWSKKPAGNQTRGGGGCPARRGSAGSRHAQVGACAAQIVMAGRAISGSSSVPARTKIRCGRASAWLNRCVPQAGQKRRCMMLPLSATLQ